MVGRFADDASGRLLDGCVSRPTESAVGRLFVKGEVDRLVDGMVRKFSDCWFLVYGGGR